MPQEHLRNHPLCRAGDLGKPIPDTKHAISMCLPRWQDVIGYEERNPATMEKLTLGYPRFLYHPLVDAACEKFRGLSDDRIQLYTTRAAADRCAAYLRMKDPDAELHIRAVNTSPVTLVSFPASLADDAKAYWQHAGEGISSRCAEALLNNIPLPDAVAAEQTILERVSECTGVPGDSIYLFPSGMAAIHAAYIASRNLDPAAPTAQFAFPYGDTLKLQNTFNRPDTLFYPRGNSHDLNQLESDLENVTICGLFCEYPTNPLLTCIDLARLRALADRHGFPIILDETLGACINQSTVGMSDVTAISLTKYFSGTSDVMGGALVLNPDGPLADHFSRQLEALHEPEAFYPADIIQLERDSRDYRTRVKQINRTARTVSDFLTRHPAIEQVFYPALADRERYDQFRRPEGGYGGLLSFVLKDAPAHTEAFYDALEITKGPNLGTSFSLCCPFVMLAHYNELDWAESAGASRYLIRLSIGLDPAEELIARIDRAIAAALNA